MTTRIIKKTYTNGEIIFVPQYKKMFGWESFTIGCMFEVIDAGFESLEDARAFLKEKTNEISSIEVIED